MLTSRDLNTELVASANCARDTRARSTTVPSLAGVRALAALAALVSPCQVSPCLVSRSISTSAMSACVPFVG